VHWGGVCICAAGDCYGDVSEEFAVEESRGCEGGCADGLFGMFVVLLFLSDPLFLV